MHVEVSLICDQTGWKMTRNQDLNILHVDNATAFVDNLQWRMVTNDTLLFDFVYFLHPVRHEHRLSSHSLGSMPLSYQRISGALLASVHA